MDRSVNFISIICILLWCSISYEEAASISSPSAWSQTPKINYCSLAQQLETGLSSYLGEDVIVDKIIFSLENNEVADNHEYIIFAEIENACECEQSWYALIQAYIGFAGQFTVNNVINYGKNEWPQ